MFLKNLTYQLDPMYLTYPMNHEDLKYLMYRHYLMFLKNLMYQMNHYFLKYH